MKYAVILCIAAMPALADPPVIETVTARQGADGWTFSVTLSHPDTGWDHYADGWRVLTEDEREIGLRVLHHPHVTEQPFTRSTSGVQVPEDTRSVRIQARCSVDGWSEHTSSVTLP